MAGGPGWYYAAGYAGTIAGPVINVIAFGADPSGVVACDTAVQAACNAAALSGAGTVVFPSGTYLFSVGGITLKSNTVLRLQGCTWKIGSSFAAASIFSPASVNDILVEGEYNLSGGNFAVSAITCTSVNGFEHNAHVNVSVDLAAGTYALVFNSCNNITLRGQVRTINTLWADLAGCTMWDVSGVQIGPVTRNATVAFVYVRDSTRGASSGTPSSRGAMHDCVCDGGNVLTFAPFAIAQSFGGGTHGQSCTARDLYGRNQPGAGDFFDLVQQDGCSVTDLVCVSCNHTVDVAGCNEVAVTGAVGVNCNSAAVQIGDVAVAFQTNLVTVNGSVGVGCGIGGQVDFTASDFVAYAPVGTSTNVVTWTGNIGYNSGAAANKYAFGIGGPGTFSSIVVEDGFMLGNNSPTSETLGASTHLAVYRNVAGLNPVGGSVNQPAVAAAATNMTNGSGVDNMLTIQAAGGGGFTPTINALAMPAVPANAVVTFFLPVNGTWSWANGGTQPAAAKYAGM